MSDIEQRIIGKSVKSACVDGYEVTIEFTDGTVFKYEASDGGYSSYSLNEVR